jgi:Fe-S-cluster containining protein
MISGGIFMLKQPFYGDGLRFSCRRCSSCCRHESGFVFLSEKDLRLLSAACKMEYTDFVKVRCRWVPSGSGQERLSLREKADYDCVFWKEGCTVYDARPLQCRSFPFWHSVLSSREAWGITGTTCPGINSGVMHSREEIDAWLEMQEAPVIIRNCKTEEDCAG